MFQELLGQSFKSFIEEHRPTVATASVLQATSTVKPSKTCCFCGKNHPTGKCFKLSGSIQVKKMKLKSADLCFRCLLPGHIAKGCSVVCRKCNGPTMKSYVVNRWWGPLLLASLINHCRHCHLVVMWMHLLHFCYQQHLSSVLQILHLLVTCPRHTHPLHHSLLMSQFMAVRVLPRQW